MQIGACAAGRSGLEMEGSRGASRWQWWKGVCDEVGSDVVGLGTACTH